MPLFASLRLCAPISVLNSAAATWGRFCGPRERGTDRAESWRYLMWMWHQGTWASDGTQQVTLTVGRDDLEGLCQSRRFCDLCEVLVSGQLPHLYMCPCIKSTRPCAR